jgi:hypothetical protein
MIVALVREHQPVSREDIDKLLLDKLPEVLTPGAKTQPRAQLACASSTSPTGSARRWCFRAR